MQFTWVLGAALALLAAAPAPARASIVFTSVLGGDAERPGAASAGGVGSATSLLSGDTGGHMLAYTLNDASLGTGADSGNIHSSILPPGQNPAEQTSPPFHPLDGELYFSIATAGHPDGEIHGQLEAIGGTTDDISSNATIIPLPTPMLVGLTGLATAAWAARRRKAITR